MTLHKVDAISTRKCQRAPQSLFAEQLPFVKMLWSFGLVVLFIDIWQRLRLGGIELSDPDPHTTNLTANITNISKDSKIHLVVHNNRSEGRHLYIYSAKSQNGSAKPKLAFKWFDVPISKVLSRHNKPLEEKNLHILPKSKLNPPTPSPSDDDVYGQFTMKTLGEYGEMDDYGEDDVEKVLHNNKGPINRVVQKDSISHRARETHEHDVDEDDE